jgi:aspartate aminotransferase|tara:strand:+ start:45 stop:1304 length:1260 start_codon:yes stop_codon:yes gene_type:complete
MNHLALRATTAIRTSSKRALSSTVSPWTNVELGPPDAILGLNSLFAADPDDRKLSVGVGAYRGADGKPFVLPSVKEAEKQLLAQNLNREYLPITGLASFNDLACDMIYGKDRDVPLAKTQVLSGTGGLRVGGEFLKAFGNVNEIYMPDPTWGNHAAIFKRCGLAPKTYRYLDRSAQSLDFSGMMEDLKALPNGAAVLLHACAHNPTGVDPNAEQWAEISALLKTKSCIPFFDSAYQGFASGDAEKDATAVRTFVSDGHPVMTTQSFSKNFGLYSDRVGCLSFVCKDDEEIQRVDSQLKLLIRPMYSNPPATGARIVSTVLESKTLNPQWYGECKAMADRIISARSELRGHLEGLGSVHNWQHITDQIGMFAFTGLDKAQCDAMINEHHIYLTGDGRVSMAGVTTSNAPYIAESIHNVTK